ncbi:MAG: DUF3332 domain-containing protein [Prevotellaceae bacterium]|jgi:hypothetical protein|nr:DUF3332 domain-containing protein [Prevotellaceae bacterium]
MKKNKFSLVVACLMGGSILLSSCIGSFALTNKVLDWNKSVGDKFVNELIFIACHIVPVYEITVLADVLVLNSIEFWTDENPIAASEVGTEKTMKGENGDYLVRTNEDGYTISKDDMQMDLSYDKTSRTWSAENNGQTTKLVTITDDGTAMLW